MKTQKWVENEWKDISNSDLEIGDIFRELNDDGTVIEDCDGNTTFEVSFIGYSDLMGINTKFSVRNPKTIFID